MKKKVEYLIGIGIIISSIGGIFFDPSSDIRLGLIFLGGSSILLGCVLGFTKRNKS